MIFDLSDIRKKTVSAGQYIDSLEQQFKEKFLNRKQEYKLQPEAVDQLRNLAEKYVIIVFSATWCKDCAEIIPVLSLLSEAAGLEVRVFGGLMKDPLSQVCKWRIPPSPPEVITFEVDKIPLIIILDLHGREIGRIVESPKRWPTLEQELCEMIKSQ
jgi:thiol-disulfide isomerase/thioredoxin